MKTCPIELLDLLDEVTDALANNVSHTSEEAKLVDRARKVHADYCPEEFPCQNPRCDSKVFTESELCGHCQGVVDARVEDYNRRFRIGARL